MRKATAAAHLAKLEAGNARSLTSWESLFLWTSQVTLRTKNCAEVQKERQIFSGRINQNLNLEVKSKTWLCRHTLFSQGLFMKHWHPLSCMHNQKETSLNLYVLEKRGEEVEMGAWSCLIITCFSQVKKQQLRFFILNVQDGYSALRWKWDSIKLSQLQHPKMETLKSQVTFISLANFLE